MPSTRSTSPPGSQDKIHHVLNSVSMLDGAEEGRAVVSHEVGIAFHHCEGSADVGGEIGLVQQVVGWEDIKVGGRGG